MDELNEMPQDFSEMSDEEFLAQPMDELLNGQKTTQDEGEEEIDPNEDENEAGDDDEEEADDADTSEDPADEEDLEEDLDESDSDDKPDTDKEDGSDEATDGDTKDDEVDADSDDVNYKAEYERLLAPFRANNKEMQVKSVDEAIRLMQQGANYNKKMQGMKPALRSLKMLENHELLDDEKLSFLIDLSKGDPKAIAKLIADKEIDPLTLSGDEHPGEYTPNTTYTVTDSAMALNEVLEEISYSSSYDKTVEVISTKWDKASQQTLIQDPRIIREINNHMEAGIYDLVVAEVEREQMLGNLKGVGDFAAYKLTGDAMAARGDFNNVGQKPTPVKKTENPTNVIKQAAKKVANPSLNKRKRAASPAKAKAATPKKGEFDPMESLSDEEFLKKFANF